MPILWFLQYPSHSTRRVIIANLDSIIFKINMYKCIPPPPQAIGVDSFQELRGKLCVFMSTAFISQTWGSNLTFLSYFYGNQRVMFDVIFPNVKEKKNFILHSVCLIYNSSLFIPLVTGTQLWEEATLIAAHVHLPINFPRTITTFYKNAVWVVFQLLHGSYQRYNKDKKLLSCWCCQASWACWLVKWHWPSHPWAGSRYSSP